MRHNGLKRVRLLKTLMRPLPRRAMLHRYPVLKWFSAYARKRSYLWSFRSEHVIPAFYGGSILCMLPIYGLQIISAFVLSLVLRTNLLVFCLLQLITNPLTAIPLYATACYVGLRIFMLVGIELPVESASDFSSSVASNLEAAFKSLTGSETSDAELEVLVAETNLTAMQMVTLGLKSTALGGAIIGAGFGFILHMIYILFAKKFDLRHTLMSGGVFRHHKPAPDKKEEAQE